MVRSLIDACAPVVARDRDAIESFIGRTSFLGRRSAHDVLIVVPISAAAMPGERVAEVRQLWGKRSTDAVLKGGR